jgi:hypothetical protein
MKILFRYRFDGDMQCKIAGRHAEVLRNWVTIAAIARPLAQGPLKYERENLRIPNSSYDFYQ